MTGEQYYFFGSGRTAVHRFAIMEIWGDTGEVYSKAPGPKSRFYVQRELIAVRFPLDDTPQRWAFSRTEMPYISAVTFVVNSNQYGYYKNPEELLSILSSMSETQDGITLRRLTKHEYARLRKGMMGLVRLALNKQAYLP